MFNAHNLLFQIWVIQLHDLDVVEHCWCDYHVTLTVIFNPYPLRFFPHQVHITSNGVNSTELSFERPPSILVPLKVHTPPKGYQLYMTCAVRGCPTPTVSWYLNDVCINSDSNYYMTNSFGVCSMYILRVRSKDSGDYKVVAVNPLGKAECSTKLTVRGKF